MDARELSRRVARPSGWIGRTIDAALMVAFVLAHATILLGYV